MSVINIGDECESDDAEKAREIWYGYQHGVLEPESKGYCLDADGAVVFGVEVQGCWIDDGDAIYLVGFAGHGAGLPGGSLTGGELVSNAKRGDDLRGETLCVGFGVGAGPAVSAAVCLGSYVDTDQGFEYNGIFSPDVGAGVGGGILPIDVHIIPGYTGVTQLFDYPQFWGDGPPFRLPFSF